VTQTDFDVLIIGAGVAGSTAAIRLAQAGWSVALVEKQRFPRRKVCGECVAAPNLALLDALGTGLAFERLAGAPLRRVALCVGEDTLIAPLPRSTDSAHPWGRALGREHLDTLLLHRAAALGATVWQPWIVRAMSREGLHHLCRVQARDSGDSVTLRAPVVIDAHGSWGSDPRGEETRRHPARGSDLFAFKGNFTGAELDPDLLPVLTFPGGYGGMVLADGGVLTLACCLRRDLLQSIRDRAPGVKAAVAVQAHLAASCRAVRDALDGARQEGAWLSAGPIRPGLRTPSRSPTEFAIGNAAGEAHPILGEGISMAIQSAWLLCDQLIPQRDELIAGRAGARAARVYASAWRRNFAPRIRAAALFAHLAMRAARASWAMPLLRRWPGILTASARFGGKVSCAVVPTATPTSTPSVGMAHHRSGHQEPE